MTKEERQKLYYELFMTQAQPIKIEEVKIVAGEVCDNDYLLDQILELAEKINEIVEHINKQNI